MASPPSVVEADSTTHSSSQHPPSTLECWATKPPVSQHGSTSTPLSRVVPLIRQSNSTATLMSNPVHPLTRGNSLLLQPQSSVLIQLTTSVDESNASATSQTSAGVLGSAEDNQHLEDVFSSLLLSLLQPSYGIGEQQPCWALPFLRLLTGLESCVLNNCGSPWDMKSSWNLHSKSQEMTVVEETCHLFQLDPAKFTGYVANTISTASIYIIYMARKLLYLHRSPVVESTTSASRCNKIVLFYSQNFSSHVANLCKFYLDMEAVEVTRNSDTGGIDMDDLTQKTQEMNSERNYPYFILCVSLLSDDGHGDNVIKAATCLRELVSHERCHIVCDVGSASYNLVIGDTESARISDSLIIRGMSLGCVSPAVIVLVPETAHQLHCHVPIVGGHDSTIEGSRNGHQVMYFYVLLKGLGREGLKAIAAYRESMRSSIVMAVRAAGIQCRSFTGSGLIHVMDIDEDVYNTMKTVCPYAPAYNCLTKSITFAIEPYYEQDKVLNILKNLGIADDILHSSNFPSNFNISNWLPDEQRGKCRYTEALRYVITQLLHRNNIAVLSRPFTGIICFQDSGDFVNPAYFAGKLDILNVNVEMKQVNEVIRLGKVLYFGSHTYLNDLYDLLQLLIGDSDACRVTEFPSYDESAYISANEKSLAHYKQELCDATANELRKRGLPAKANFKYNTVELSLSPVHSPRIKFRFQINRVTAPMMRTKCDISITDETTPNQIASIVTGLTPHYGVEVDANSLPQPPMSLDKTSAQGGMSYVDEINEFIKSLLDRSIFPMGYPMNMTQLQEQGQLSSIFPYQIPSELVRSMEQDIVSFVCKEYLQMSGDWIGIITSGSTESNQIGLATGFRRWKESGLKPLLIITSLAHYGIKKIAEQYESLDVVEIVCSRLEYSNIATILKKYSPDEYGIVVSITFGSTMIGNIDDIGRLLSSLQSCGWTRAKIHVHMDAALFGLLNPEYLRSQELNVDTLSLSAYKVIGTCLPSSIYLCSSAMPLLRFSVEINSYIILTLYHVFKRFGLPRLLQLGPTCRQLTNVFLSIMAEDIPLLHPTKYNDLSNIIVTNILGHGARRLWMIPTGYWTEDLREDDIFLPSIEENQPHYLECGGIISHIVCLPHITRDQVRLFTSHIYEEQESVAAILAEVNKDIENISQSEDDISIHQVRTLNEVRRCANFLKTCWFNKFVFEILTQAAIDNGEVSCDQHLGDICLALVKAAAIEGLCLYCLDNKSRQVCGVCIAEEFNATSPKQFSGNYGTLFRLLTRLGQYFESQILSTLNVKPDSLGLIRVLHVRGLSVAPQIAGCDQVIDAMLKGIIRIGRLAGLQVVLCISLDRADERQLRKAQLGSSLGSSWRGGLVAVDNIPRHLRCYVSFGDHMMSEASRLELEAQSLPSETQRKLLLHQSDALWRQAEAFRKLERTCMSSPDTKSSDEAEMRTKKGENQEKRRGRFARSLTVVICGADEELHFSPRSPAAGGDAINKLSKDAYRNEADKCARIFYAVCHDRRADLIQAYHQRNKLIKK